MAIYSKIRSLAKNLRSEIFILYYTMKDPRVIWYVKVLIFLIVAYAASPIDLIPDFIPFFGYLDDAIILPIAIYLVLKLIPLDILEEHKQRVKEKRFDRKIKILGTIIVSLIILCIIGIIVFFIQLFNE